MKSRPPRNMAASVKQRLLNLARERREDFNFLLLRYGSERLLHRLSRSPFAAEFILKGALLFHLAPVAIPHRPTKDVDLLGKGTPDLGRLATVFRRVSRTRVPDDGLLFDPTSVTAGRIREDREYEGVRVKLLARLGAARISVQVDVGFGDAVTPAPKLETLGTLLDLPAPRLRIYPWATVIAEKCQAIVDLGMANTRMKDFFDLHHLAGAVPMEGTLLARALAATFKRRKTDVSRKAPVGLSEDFARDPGKRAQWTAFLRRLGAESPRPPLPGVLVFLREFLMPPLESLSRKDGFQKTWSPGGPWR